MPETRWIVTTSAERTIAQVTAEIGKAGLRVGEVMAEIGVITVHGSASAARKLKGRPGIADIAPDGPVDIGPPGTDPS